MVHFLCYSLSGWKRTLSSVTASGGNSRSEVLQAVHQLPTQVHVSLASGLYISYQYLIRVLLLAYSASCNATRFSESESYKNEVILVHFVL